MPGIRGVLYDQPIGILSRPETQYQILAQQIAAIRARGLPFGGFYADQYATMPQRQGIPGVNGAPIQNPDPALIYRLLGVVRG